eukprot:Colp12_sorted_trinity150504_noHs@33818
MSSTTPTGPVHLEVYFRNEIRRLAIPVNIKFVELVQLLEQVISQPLVVNGYTVKWIDNEGDYISFSSDHELELAIQHGQSAGVLRIVLVAHQQFECPRKQARSGFGGCQRKARQPSFFESFPFQMQDVEKVLSDLSSAGVPWADVCASVVQGFTKSQEETEGENTKTDGKDSKRSQGRCPFGYKPRSADEGSSKSYNPQPDATGSDARQEPAGHDSDSEASYEVIYADKAKGKEAEVKPDLNKKDQPGPDADRNVGASTAPVSIPIVSTSVESGSRPAVARTESPAAPAVVSTPPPFRFEWEAVLLREMGFYDDENVRRLLAKLNGRMDLVVSELTKAQRELALD